MSTTDTSYSTGAGHPQPAAIALVMHQGRFLLVKRAAPPYPNCWGFPGGRLRLGETGLAAAVRELREETGVVATPDRYLTNIDIIHHDADGCIAFHYLLAVVMCHYHSGRPFGSDDAQAAGWFTTEEAAELDQVPQMQAIFDILLS